MKNYGQENDLKVFYKFLNSQFDCQLVTYEFQ